MTEDCEEGGTIRCCVDGFVVWVFDFFILIICHLRAQLCLELLVIFKISSFYFMVHAKPYGLLVIKVGQCQQSERQVEQIIQWKENMTTWVHILFIVHQNFLVLLNAHIHRPDQARRHSGRRDMDRRARLGAGGRAQGPQPARSRGAGGERRQCPACRFGGGCWSR